MLPLHCQDNKVGGGDLLREFVSCCVLLCRKQQKMFSCDMAQIITVLKAGYCMLS